MSFLELNMFFVAAAVVVFGIAVSTCIGKVAKLKATCATAVAIAVLAVLTAVFDNVMIASGLFDYGGETLNGFRVGLAPIEDFAYPLAAGLLLPGLWILMNRSRRS